MEFMVSENKKTISALSEIVYNFWKNTRNQPSCLEVLLLIVIPVKLHY